MRLLLDTRIFLWVVTGNSALKAPVRRMLEEAEQVYVSAAQAIAEPLKLITVDGVLAQYSELVVLV